MKQSEARVRIIQEWDRWIVTQAIEQDRPTGKDSLKFFHELQDTGSSLLDFQSRGQDKWRIIHAWLLGQTGCSMTGYLPRPGSLRRDGCGRSAGDRTARPDL